jgi:hypothetical protein
VLAGVFIPPMPRFIKDWLFPLLIALTIYGLVFLVEWSWSEINKETGKKS